MTDRPLTSHERALIAAAVAFCAVPSSGYYQDDDRLLRRIADITDAIQHLSLADQLIVTTGPMQDIYGDAVKLVKAQRNKDAGNYAESNYTRWLACDVLAYFERRSIAALSALGLPDHVPATEKTKAAA